MKFSEEFENDVCVLIDKKDKVSSYLSELKEQGIFNTDGLSMSIEALVISDEYHGEEIEEDVYKDILWQRGSSVYGNYYFKLRNGKYLVIGFNNL